MARKLKKEEKNLLVLLIIALIVVGIYFGINVYTDYKNKKKEALKKEEIKYIFKNFQKDNINFIQIKNLKNNYNIILKKENNHWKFIEPAGLRSDDSSVESYLLSVKYLTWVTKLEDEKVDESLFGFKNPELSIKFSGENKDENFTYSILIGGKSPIGDRYYIRKNGKKTIYVIDSLTHDSLIAKIDDLRNKKIFSVIPLQEIGYIEFHNYIDSIHNTFYYFNKNWVWKFKNVERVFKENSLAVKTLLDRISEFGVEKFLDKTPVYKNPDYKIVIKSMDNKKIEEFDLIESDENLPPIQKKFTFVDKKSGKTYQGIIPDLYTYFTEKPYKFFQESAESKE